MTEGPIRKLEIKKVEGSSDFRFWWDLMAGPIRKLEIKKVEGSFDFRVR